MTSAGLALSLWQLGLSVIPVPRPSDHHDGKRPIIAWKQYQQRRPTWDELASWFAGRVPQNLAVITGAVSGVVVVDVDSPEAAPWVREHLRRTPWIVRTARGWHLYYRHPGAHVGNRAHLEGIKLDVRGDGGFVVGPGSVHASGHVYRRQGDWSVPVAELPVFDVSLLARRRELATGAPPAPPPDAAEKARRYLKRIPPPVEGQGSDLLTFRTASLLMRKIGLAPPDVVPLLAEWAPAFDRWWIRRKVASAAANLGLR